MAQYPGNVDLLLNAAYCLVDAVLNEAEKINRIWSLTKKSVTQTASNPVMDCFVEESTPLSYS
jgi:hypothetical protein